MTAHVDVMELVSRMRSADEAFVLATVVRTVSVTAAKAGAKAVIRPDGTIVAGWIGGGCARGAVLKAAQDALLDGESRLVSVQPENLLVELGVQPGESRQGIRFAKNTCPSKGTMDIFVEPVLPRPSLVILGASPVAIALADLARYFGFHITAAAPPADFTERPNADLLVEGFDIPEAYSAHCYIVVSTQSKGDEAALRAALKADAVYLGFVGSRRKIAVLKAKLAADGIDAAALARIKAPAGLDLGAITPEEIALSILAEIIERRRHGQRQPAGRQSL
ncbi:XdhC/CoxI family protein [Rhizobium jaguaris]|uniref:XdhC family protein n=1 Tax=Rhizobium jaguaris TaxID=1312183 RepID=UPI0039BEE4CE